MKLRAFILRLRDDANRFLVDIERCVAAQPNVFVKEPDEDEWMRMLVVWREAERDKRAEAREGHELHSPSPKPLPRQPPSPQPPSASPPAPTRDGRKK
jgi:hypothetical protein